MSDALVVQLADALAADLNQAAFNKPLTAVVRFDTEVDYTELDELEHIDVTVIPADKSRAREARAMHRDEMSIDLGVRRKVESKDDNTVRELLAVVEQIEQHCTDFSPDLNGRRAVFMEIQTDPLFDPVELKTNHLFFSVMRVFFRAN